MAGLRRDVPRAIALIDLLDLRSQMKRIGGESEPDLTGLLERLRGGLAGLDPGSSERLEGDSARLSAASGEGRLPLRAVYLYSPLEADRSHAAERVVFRERGVGVKRECQGCGKACTHCQGGAIKDTGGQGRDSLLGGDLLELDREDAYDWAVVVSADILLIPVVRYVQSHGRRIVHACFPPVAMDLTKECWASIDLSTP